MDPLQVDARVAGWCPTFFSLCWSEMDRFTIKQAGFRTVLTQQKSGYVLFGWQNSPISLVQNGQPCESSHCFSRKIPMAQNIFSLNGMVENLQETIMNHKPHQTIDFPMDFPIICRIPSIFPIDFPIISEFPGDLPQQLRGSPWRTALSLLRSLPEERTTPEARQIDWGMGMDGTWEVFTQKKNPVFDPQKLEVEPKKSDEHRPWRFHQTWDPWAQEKWDMN